MRGFFLTLIILAIAAAGNGCASIHPPPYTLDQETSDAVGVIGSAAVVAGEVAAAGAALAK